MSVSTRRALLSVVVACCSCTQRSRTTEAPSAAVDEARVVVDFAGVDAWLACARTTADLRVCEAASAATPGGRVGVLSTATFGLETPPTPVPPTKASVEALVAQMKMWPDALARAARFLPTRVGGGPLRVFVVANGHPWGDAYVRGVQGNGDAARLSDTGEPTIILNASLIASGYPGTVMEQAESALGVLSHELFHAVFRRYRSGDPGWARVAHDTSPRHELQVLVLDEGVAHFVDRESELMRDGFPPERARASLVALGNAWQRLESVAAESAEAGKILSSANQGRYWDKFGSIAGMQLAHGVFRSAGAAGIREAVRCGPGRLLSLYARATTRFSDLPALPASLRVGTWFDLCSPSR
jgi:putative zinc-dependent peptidase DUF5700